MLRYSWSWVEAVENAIRKIKFTLSKKKSLFFAECPERKKNKMGNWIEIWWDYASFIVRNRISTRKIFLFSVHKFFLMTWNVFRKNHFHVEHCNSYFSSLLPFCIATPYHDLNEKNTVLERWGRAGKKVVWQVLPSHRD